MTNMQIARTPMEHTMTDATTPDWMLDAMAAEYAARVAEEEASLADFTPHQEELEAWYN